MKTIAAIAVFANAAVAALANTVEVAGRIWTLGSGATLDGTVATFHVDGVRDTAQSRVSDVVVTPLATGAMPDWSETEFDLSGGAQFYADFPGTVKVKKLRVDGVSKIGEFNSSNSNFVVGNGTIEVMPSTFMLIMR